MLTTPSSSCSVENCAAPEHKQGLCIEHYEQHLREAPKERGGRRRQKPLPDHQPTPARSPKGRWLPGSSGNPHGLPRPVVELRLLARTMTPEAFHTLREIHLDPKQPAQARAYAANKLIEHGIGTAPMAVFHGGDMPGKPGLLDEETTPLTRLAASNKGADREAELRRELARIDQERERARAAKEDQLAAARTAKARGEEIHPALAMLLRVKDDDS